MFELIKELFNISQPKGFSEDEIMQVRNMYGKLPYILEAYYRKYGRETAVNHTQNSLIVPWKYTWPKSESHLIIYGENQWVCCWGIPLRDLKADNPPVYISHQNDMEWEIESNRLSDFLIAMAHVHAGFALAFGSKNIFCINEVEAGIIRNKFKKKCEPMKRWLEGVEFYGNDPCDTIVMNRNGDYYDLFYASGDEMSYNKMNTVLSKLGGAY